MWFTMLLQFDRERIPERVVHARGASAKGFFEVPCPFPSCRSMPCDMPQLRSTYRYHSISFAALVAMSRHE